MNSVTRIVIELSSQVHKLGSTKNLHLIAGVYIGKYPPWGGNISQCHLGEKYEKVKRKRGKILKKKEEMEKKKEERGKKRRKGEVKG
jgi:hypothetical protein